MAATWTPPVAFAPAMLGAPFVAMQPEPSAGLRYSLFELAEPEALLSAAMTAIDNGTTPIAAAAEFLFKLGDQISLINGPLPGGPGTEKQAIGPIFTPESFDDSATNRASQKAALENALAVTGNGKVAMGCIDSSIAFVNARFRKKNTGGGPDRTRFDALWIQGRAAKTPGPYASILRAGTLLLRQDIDALIAKHWRNGRLDEAAVYAEFTAPPNGFTDLWKLGAGHGTSVLDLMAGASRDTGDDDTPLYGVELPLSVISDTSGAVFHGPLTYGLGVVAMLSYAIARTSSNAPAPLVANISMGYLGGPPNGNHPTPKALTAIANAAKGPGSAARDVDVTVPAGNQLQDRIHARSQPTSPTTFRWSMPPEDRTASFVEIWNSDFTAGPDVTEVTLIPSGSSGGVTTALPQPGECIHLQDNGKRLAQLHNLGTHLMIGVYPTASWTPGGLDAPSGLWHLTVKGAGAADTLFWIARDNSASGFKSAGRQSWFRDPTYTARDGYGDYIVASQMAASGVRRDGTLSVLATAATPIEMVSGREARGAKPFRFAGLEIGQATPPAPAPFAPAAEVSRNLGGPMAARRKGRGTVRIPGTSFASAIRARNIADGIRGTTSGPLGYREPDHYRY